MSVKNLVYTVEQVEQDPQLSWGLILHYTSQGDSPTPSCCSIFVNRKHLAPAALQALMAQPLSSVAPSLPSGSSYTLQEGSLLTQWPWGCP